MSIYHKQHNKKNTRRKIMLYGFLILMSSIRVDRELFNLKYILLVPEISSIAVYHFYIYKKRLSLFFVFILGIWNDSTLNIPLGISSLCYVTLVLIFSFFENMNLKKISDKIQYMKFFYFISCCAFFKYISLNITGNITNSYHLFSLVLTSMIFYVLLLAHFFEYIDRKIFRK